MPDEILNDSICKAHSGIIARIKNCEDDVKALWNKWVTLRDSHQIS